ncbi:hypothetical protein I6F11_04255 [Ensifer sp. NBAIM29]|nr:hypothetical protein [Ensifer sp. NBAIM29]
MIIGIEDGAEYSQVAPDELPAPKVLSVSCPWCDTAIEYEPAQDDAGAFYCMEEWPVCHDCKVLIDVPPVRISKVDGTYFVSDLAG